MADGSELTAPYKYGFRNLVFGSGTDIVTEKVDGILSMPTATANDTDKQFDHGAFPGMVVMGKRIIAFDMKVKGAAGDDIENKLAVLRKTFQVPRKRHARVLEPFTFWRPGQPKKMCLVRCTRRDFTSEFATARGLASGSVELQAPTPLIYSVKLNEKTLTLPDDELAANIQIYQNGDYDDGAWPVLTITGPCTNPIITSDEDDGRAIRLDLDIADGDTAVIDVEKEIVWINGVRSSDSIRSDNQWWALLPGYNTITYNRQGGATDSTLTIAYRDTWQ